MARPFRYKPKQVIEALEECKGMVSLAARKLGCTPRAVYTYAEKFPAVQRAKDDALVEFLDAAELTMWNAVQRGDTGAAMFVLRYLGRSRGYVDRREDKLEAHVVTGTIAEWEQRLQAAHTALEERRAKALEADFKDVTHGRNERAGDT